MMMMMMMNVMTHSGSLFNFIYFKMIHTVFCVHCIDDRTYTDEVRTWRKYVHSIRESIQKF
jgi:hypothetical protein